jgi:hypothetical protein
MRSVIALAAWLSLNGCGVFVPEIQDFGDQNYQIQMVQAIVHNITCEVRDAVNDLYSNRKHTYMDDWGVQISLDLTLVEKSDLAPDVNWMPPSPASAIFTLKAGIDLSSQATRTDKLNSFYTIRELLRLGHCDARARPGGPMLMQSDLKLSQWLLDTTTIQETRVATFNNKALDKDVIFHEVKFEVNSSGTINPSWTLTRATVNNGTFFSTNRNRAHDLQLTFGPTDQKDPGPGTPIARARPGPGFTASNTALAGQIGLSVANNLKSSVRP